MTEDDKDESDGPNRIRVSYIPLYHGSLAELNSRDPDVQYDLVKDRDEATYCIEGYNDLTRTLDEIRTLVLKDGFSGLVNRRTSHAERGAPLTVQRSFIVEGTPVVRTKD